MTALLQSVGFNIHHCDSNTSSYSYRTVSDLRQALTSVNPFLERIPSTLQDDFMNDCIDVVFNGNLREVFPLDEQTVRFNYTQIIVFARK
jgi:hypothetical protein